MEDLEKLIASLEKSARREISPLLQTLPFVLTWRDFDHSMAVALRAAGNDREAIFHILLNGMESPGQSLCFSLSASRLLEREAIGNEMVISRCLRWLETPGSQPYLMTTGSLLIEIAVGHPLVIHQCLREMELRRDNDIVHQSTVILAKIASGNEEVIRRCLGFLPGKPEDGEFVGQVASVLCGIGIDYPEVVIALCDIVETRLDGWAALLLEEAAVGNDMVINRCLNWLEDPQHAPRLRQLATDILAAVSASQAA